MSVKKERRQLAVPDLKLTGSDGTGIGTSELDDEAVTTAKIADANVTAAKMDGAQLKTQKYQYDFADLGGATGAITLTDEDDAAQQIPDDAVIVGVYLEPLTDPTSGGSATIALGYTGNTDAFLAATAFDNTAFTGDTITAGDNDLPVKTSAARSVLATIATAALTAGKFNVYVQYHEGD